MLSGTCNCDLFARTKGSFCGNLHEQFGHVDLLFRRNSLIAPYEFTMEKLLFVVRSLKERLVINLESLLLHGNEDLREQILDREERGKSKV